MTEAQEMRELLENTNTAFWLWARTPIQEKPLCAHRLLDVFAQMRRVQAWLDADSSSPSNEDTGDERDGLGQYECQECGSSYHPTSECPNTKGRNWTYIT